MCLAGLHLKRMKTSSGGRYSCTEASGLCHEMFEKAKEGSVLMIAVVQLLYRLQVRNEIVITLVRSYNGGLMHFFHQEVASHC